MEEHVHYSTVSEAINELRKKGFTTDFNIEENYLVCDQHKFEADDFDVVEVYRYEGNTDPADEAIVYAIASGNGLKGILVTGYGIYADSYSAKVIQKLNAHWK